MGDVSQRDSTQRLPEQAAAVGRVFGESLAALPESARIPEPAPFGTVEAVPPARAFKLASGDHFTANGETYTIQKALPKGGEGVSYLATTFKGDRKVIKIQRETNGNNLEDKLRTELMQANKVLGTHTCLARLNDIDVAVVRDYVEGLNLVEYLGMTNRTFTQAETIAFLRDITAEALVPLHDEHLVHRDVKPQNIITEKEAGKAYTLIDFGLLRSEGDDATMTMSVRGTPGYMRPPCTDTMQNSIQEDYYGLAETAYFLLSGKNPKNQWSTREDKADDTDKLAHLSIDTELRAVLLKMLGHNGTYEKPQQLVKDLEHVATRLNPSTDIAIDLQSAKTLAEYRSKLQPGEQMREELAGITQVFKEMYAPVRFARLRPLNDAFRTRLEKALHELHYESLNPGRTVYARQRLHDGLIDVLVVKDGADDHFDFFQVGSRDKIADRLQRKPLDRDKWYTIAKNTVGRTLPVLASYGIGAAFGNAMTGLYTGLGVATLAGLGALFCASTYEDGLEFHNSAWLGLIPVCMHHAFGKIAYWTADGLHALTHQERSGQDITDEACLARAFEVLPLYTYDAKQ